MNRKLVVLCAISAVIGLTGCDAETALDAGPGTDAAPTSDAGMCTGGVVESDLNGVGPEAWVLAGPGVDPATGELTPRTEGFVVSSTYLRIRPTGQMRFGQLIEPVVGSMMTSPGLLAFALGSSEECGTARTMTVWEDEASMMAFVVGPAHAAAVSAIAEVSRGDSLVLHWNASTPDDASPSEAVRRIAEYTGPRY